MRIRDAQKALKKASYYGGKIDGLEGRNTRASVRAALASASVDPGSVQMPLVAAAQVSLRDLGHDPGAIDGIDGPGTQRALAAAFGRRKRGPGRRVDTIFVHCAATDPGWYIDQPIERARDEIDRWHRARGFRKIGYHYLIDRRGTVIAGRRESKIGAHARGYNRRSIAICLLGGKGSHERDQFEQNFTQAQDRAARELIRDIEDRHPIERVRGHNEVAAKACPGFQVKEWLRG